MFLYEIDDTVNQYELDEIYMDILNTYLEFGTVGIIQKDKRYE